MNRYGNAVAALTAACIGLFALEARAQPKKGAGTTKPMRVMVILDASGSMRGRVGKMQKIIAARKAMRALLKDWDSRIPLGLTVYGHRHRNQCTDIQTLFPVGRVNAATIAKTVDGIAPKGRTPITAALVHAAKALNYRKERTTIILISDGLETCNANPCAVARQLKGQGLDFRIHVVGLGLRQREIKALRCISDNSGGAFFDARSAGDLRKAMVSAAGAIRAARLAEPVKEQPATLKAPASLQVNTAFQVHWKGQNKKGDHVTITREGTFDNAFYSRAFVTSGNPVTLKSPDRPGNYVIRYVSGRTIKVLGEVKIAIFDYTARLTAPDSVEIGEAFKVEWTGPAKKGDYIIIVKKGAGRFAYGSRVVAKDGKVANLSAPMAAGDYEIRYMVNKPKRRVLFSRPITVRDATVTLAAAATVKAGDTIEIKWTGPRLAGGLIGFAQEGSSDRAYIFGSYEDVGKAARPLSLRAPKKPGVYEIRYRLRWGLNHRVMARIRVVVTAAK